jgi:hypothetical protein
MDMEIKRGTTSLLNNDVTNVTIQKSGIAFQRKMRPEKPSNLFAWR